MEVEINNQFEELESELNDLKHAKVKAIMDRDKKIEELEERNNKLTDMCKFHHDRAEELQESNTMLKKRYSELHTDQIESLKELRKVEIPRIVDYHLEIARGTFDKRVQKFRERIQDLTKEYSNFTIKDTMDIFDECFEVEKK